MKKIILIVFLVCFVQSKAQESPNIILFLVDDLGWVDTSVPFGKDTVPYNRRYFTPNMERLASQGMKFTNAYATPVCTPSRVSLLTGMNAAHHGVTNWTSPFRDRNTDRPDTELMAADWNVNGLSPVAGVPNTVHASVFPEILKNNGYFTIHVGKGHWASAGTPGANPHNLGFSVNITGNSTGRPFSYLGTENYGNQPNVPYNIHTVEGMAEYYGSETYLTEALTMEALKAIEAPIENEQPFFLNMSHYAVHDPYDPDKRFLQKYLDAGLPEVEAIYASMIEGMDKSLGDIMDFLEKKEVNMNTIILFMSDNGGLSLTYSRAGEPHVQNAPLKAGKGSVYEGGIRVPMLVKWPDEVEQASVDSTPVIIEDFFPTILGLAGISDYKTIQEVDGRSLIPLLKGGYISEERSLIWHFPNKWIDHEGPGINYRSAIRKGDWKLIYNMKTGKAELYNLRKDLGETSNLASDFPEKVKKLSGELGRLLKTWEAPMPVRKETGSSVTLPN